MTSTGSQTKAPWVSGLIVAEIGNNHEGQFDVAQEMVQRAAECKVDAVKFQTLRAEHIVRRSDRARFERLKSFELTPEQFSRLSELTHSLNLLFLSTPLDLESARILEPLVDAYKIASGDISFWPLQEKVAATGKPIVLSTGVCHLHEVDEAVAFLSQKRQASDETLALLHCVSAYPTPVEQANLNAIPFLARRFGLTVGYSDHTEGIEVAATAAAMGAAIIEKHFTLDKQFSDFRDHALSADPADMRELVNRIRRIRAMQGEAHKIPQPCEDSMKVALRRSVAAAADRVKGHRMAMEDLTWVRPGDGLQPGLEKLILGRRLKHPVKQGDHVRENDVE